MSEIDEQEAVVEETAPEPEPELQPEPEPEPEPEPQATVKRSSAGVAWLALLLSVVAVTAAGYLIFDNWQTQRAAARSADPLADIRSRIASSSETLANLNGALDELEATDTGIASQLELLQQNIESRLQALDSLPPRMSNLENSLSALQGISTGARNAWLIAEAEYYMQIANAQLQLAGNPQLAAQALSMADERIAQLADPALTEVRRAVADELAALDGMDKPDVEGITLNLASLARVVASLPLTQAATADADTAMQDQAQISSIDRAWTSVKGAIGGLVKHSKPGETTIPLMTPEAEYFLRTNLTLQLQAARLALLRGEQAVFQQSLGDAAAWLTEYFDADSTQVTSALQTITEIRDSMVTVSKPDISESLRLLRQFKALTGPAQ